jgi:hypothetical protein
MVRSGTGAQDGPGAVKVRFKLFHLGSILAEICGWTLRSVVGALQGAAILSPACHNSLQAVGVNGKFASHSDVRLAGVALLSKRAQGGTGKLIEGVKRGVQGPWGFVRRCCFLGFALALAACTNLKGSFEVTPFLNEQITGDTWRACLAREYQAQARAQIRASRNWSDAIRLADKGRAALASPEPLGRENPCQCAKAEARSEALAVSVERGADTTAIRKGLDEARAACAPPR